MQSKESSVSRNFFYLDLTRTRYTFEPIEGCSIGCPYCNAYTGSRQITDWGDWINPVMYYPTLKVVSEEFDRLNKNYPMQMDFIFICSNSDPFQSEESTEIVYKSLNIFNKLNLYTRVLSKGVLPKWLDKFPKNSVGITIDSVDRFRKSLELGNIEVLKYLSSKNIHTKISLQPFDLSTDIEWMSYFLERIKFIKQITFGILDDAPVKDFKRGYEFADIIADFCLKNKINYFNGSPRFNKASKKRLAKMGVNSQIWFGDNIPTEPENVIIRGVL